MTIVDKLALDIKKTLDEKLRISNPMLYERIIDLTLGLPIVANNIIYVYSMGVNKYVPLQKYEDGNIHTYMYGSEFTVRNVNILLQD